MPSKHCSRKSGVSSTRARAFAASVLPTPGSPSSSSGCGSRTAAEIALSVLAELVADRRAAERHAPVAAPATAIDPVCGMTVAAVDSSPHVTVDGTTTWFCCAGCRTAFVEDPARYAPTA